MNVVLLGMKGCGKSTLGRLLARRLGRAFYDWDELVVAEHRRRTGEDVTVRELFAQRGEDYFAQIEAAVGAELHPGLARREQRAVIALGGRTAANPGVRYVLLHLGLKIHLRADPHELFERVMADGLPPFLDPDDPKGSFLRLCEQRTEYATLADATVDVTGRTPEQAVQELVRVVREHENGR